MDTLTISSVSQFLSSIEKLQNYYPANIQNKNPVENSFLYRGISNKAYRLIPSVFRERNDNIDGKAVSNKIYLSWTNEKSLLQSFIHEASGVLSIPPSELVHWTEYAQHYGVPTRFLDWTSNPLTAMYFACRDRTNEDGIIWLLHESNYRRFLDENISIPDNKTITEIIETIINGQSTVEYPVLYSPYYVDARMSAQGSYFMVWGTKEDPLEILLSDEKYKISMPAHNNSQLLEGKSQEVAILFSFVIPAENKQFLLHELDMIGINEKTLFPGLDGIGRYIERRFRFDYRETVGAQQTHQIVTSEFAAAME